LQKIQQAITRDGLTQQQFEAAVNSLGPLGTVADLEDNPNIRSLAEGIANTPGPGQTAARQYLATRSEGQTQRMNDAVRTATGAVGSAFDNMEALQQARSMAAAPAYQNAFANTQVTPADAAALDRFINNPIGQRALQSGIANLRLQSIANGTPFNAADYGVVENQDGTVSLLQAPGGTPNLRLYDAVKRGYDTLAEDFRDATSGRMNLSGTISIPGVGGQITGTSIQSVRQAYTSALRSMFPDYGAALDAWSGPSADMDALSMGRRVLTADPDVTASNVANLTPSQRQMYNVGVAQAMKDRIAGTQDQADATRRLFGNDLIRSKIAAGFGGETTPEFQNFQNMMEQEAQYARTQRELIHGSPTARRTAAIQAAAQPAPPVHLLEPLGHVVSGNIPGAGWALARQGANQLANWAMQPSDRVNALLGQYLFNPATQPDLVNQLRGGVPAPMVNRLMSPLAQQAMQSAINRQRNQGATQ